MREVFDVSFGFDSKDLSVFLTPALKYFEERPLTFYSVAFVLFIVLLTFLVFEGFLFVKTWDGLKITEAYPTPLVFEGTPLFIA